MGKKKLFQAKGSKYGRALGLEEARHIPLTVRRPV